MPIDSVVLHQRYSVMAAFYGRAYASASDHQYLDNYIIRHILVRRKAHRHNGAISGTCSSKKLFYGEDPSSRRGNEWALKVGQRSSQIDIKDRDVQTETFISALILTRNLITPIGTYIPVWLHIRSILLILLTRSPVYLTK